MFYRASQPPVCSPCEVRAFSRGRAAPGLAVGSGQRGGAQPAHRRGIATFPIPRLNWQHLCLSAGCWRPLGWHGSLKGCVRGWCGASSSGLGPAGKLPMSGICRNTSLVEETQEDLVLKVIAIYFLYWEYVFNNISDNCLKNSAPFSSNLSWIKKAVTLGSALK